MSRTPVEREFGELYAILRKLRRTTRARYVFAVHRTGSCIASIGNFGGIEGDLSAAELGHINPAIARALEWAGPDQSGYIPLPPSHETLFLCGVTSQLVL